MKLKLTSPGYTKFSGFMGGVMFENGVSVDDVSKVEARALGSIMRVESLEDGHQVGDAADLRRNSSTPAASVPRYIKPEIVPKDAPSDAETPQSEAKKSLDLPIDKLTKDDLEAIADSHGINGLREIGDRFGIKGRGIRELIDAILKAQN